MSRSVWVSTTARRKCSSECSPSIVREFVVDLLFAVGRAEGRLDHGVGVPRADGHHEREPGRLGIAQRFDLAAQHVGPCLKRPLRLSCGGDGPAQAVGFGDALGTDFDRQVGQRVGLAVTSLRGRVELPREAADLQLGRVTLDRVEVGED